MQTAVYSIGLLLGLFALIGAVLPLARRRYPNHADTVVDRVEALLPQTQCTQCGYPGCRPYAQALVGGARLDLCPPGGADTQAALARLLGRDPGQALDNPGRLRARIDESRCVGCFLCVAACPVDAIVGAPRFMHTVIADRCTGCELCLPPCPMDCIELLPVAAAAAVEYPADSAPCIRCNRCEAVCPEALEPQTLWWYARGDDLSRAVRLGLEHCIECGLCNPECPSGIDLVGVFQAAKATLAGRREAERIARRARQDHERHNARLASEALIASDRRRARLAALPRPDL